MRSDLFDISHVVESRKRVVDHCAWLATMDRAYAVWTFEQYDKSMPWLELRNKNRSNHG